MTARSVKIPFTKFPGQSWTAYMKPTAVGVALLLVAGGVWSWRWEPGMALVVVAFGYLAHRLLTLRSFRFYCDDVGVWYSRGYLPWTRNIRWGVAWRDIGEATFTVSFWSWLLRSSSIRVRHRFTRYALVLPHMRKGAESAGKINGIHHELWRAGLLS